MAPRAAAHYLKGGIMGAGCGGAILVSGDDMALTGYGRREL